jgi:hypothetical protein
LVSSVLQAAVMMIAPSNGRQKIRKFFMSLDHGGRWGPAWGIYTQVNENTVPDRFGSIRESRFSHDPHGCLAEVLTAFLFGF